MGYENKCVGSNNVHLWSLFGNEKQYRSNKILNNQNTQNYRHSWNLPQNQIQQRINKESIKIPDEDLKKSTKEMIYVLFAWKERLSQLLSTVVIVVYASHVPEHTAISIIHNVQFAGRLLLTPSKHINIILVNIIF